MATSQDFGAWMCSAALDPEYLMYALMSEGDNIRRYGEGSTHTTIRFPEIRAFHIKLAPIEEQRQIVRRVRSAFVRTERLIEESRQAASLLRRLEERRLESALRGQLTVRSNILRPQGVHNVVSSAASARLATTPLIRRRDRTAVCDDTSPIAV